MERKCNLLFLFTDEQRADTLECYGNTVVQAPNLNGLARRSFVFERSYVTQPVCTPARSSIMTGLYPHTNGCTENNIPLKPERVSKEHWSELTALASGQSWRRRSMLLSSAAIPRSPCSVFGTDPAMRTSARQPNDEEVPQRCVDRMDAVPVPSPIHTRS